MRMLRIGKDADVLGVTVGDDRALVPVWDGNRYKVVLESLRSVLLVVRYGVGPCYRGSNLAA